MGIFTGIFRLYYWSFDEPFSTAAIKNSSYSVKVGSCRGNIYDCNKIPLVNEENDDYCVVFPSIDACSNLSKIISQEEMVNCIPNLNSGKPFCIKLEKQNNTKGVRGLRIFKIPRRYSEEEKILPHILGYLDNCGEGVSGIEKSFNNYLKNCSGTLSINYKTDALGRLFKDPSISVKDTIYRHLGGVVLTIDKKLQRKIKKIAKEHLKKGVIIVTQVPNCKIRGLVSMPDFDPENIKNDLNSEDSPFLNRAWQAYNAGSVFKLVTAMALLEENIDGLNNYNCEGSVVVGNSCFHCANCKSHGEQDLKKALSNSCNTYFINFSQYLNTEKFHTFIENLGFGKSSELAKDIVSEKGHVPSEDELKDLNELANTSFGQGKLMVTPLQVIALINTIASKGEYSKPTLIEGLIDQGLSFVKKFEKGKNKKVVSESTIKEIKEGMLMCTEFGTGTLGKPDGIKICAKTSTAQTGIKKDGRNILQGWFAGFYPEKNPIYSVVVLAEDIESGGVDCGPIFKEVVKETTKNYT